MLHENRPPTRGVGRRCKISVPFWRTVWGRLRRGGDAAPRARPGRAGRQSPARGRRPR
jgi:hypothetical protein